MNPETPLKLTVDLSGFDAQVQQMLQSVQEVREIIRPFRGIAEKVEWELTEHVKEKIDEITKAKEDLTQTERKLIKTNQELEIRNKDLSQMIKQKAKILRGFSK